jgi:Uma2 family endonuclease
MSAEVHAQSGWQRRLRVDEYHRMIEAGIFDEDERVELLHGILVTMSPQGPRHAHIVARLDRALQRALGDDYWVRVQLPLTLSGESEPEPDLAVVPAEATAPDRHPDRALLVIEVAACSARKDRGVKAEIYARAAVPEYWIVNVDTQEIEVHRDPDAGAGRFRTISTVSSGGSVSPVHVPGFTIQVHELFGLR